jgi:hypothetical protein
LKRTPDASAVIAAGFAAVTLLLLWRSLRWPLVHDAPIMHYIAWRIADGAVPYRDLFDMNFPGVYVLHLAVVRLLGTGDAGFRAFDLLALGAAAGAIAALAAPWGRPAAAGGALTFTTYHLAGGAWQAGQRDFLLCPLLLAAALGVARWLERRPTGARSRASSLPWSGLALGAAVTVKPHAAVFAALLGGLVVWAAWNDDGGPRRPLLAYASALAVVPVAIVLWLAATGGLAPWWRIVSEYVIPLYGRLGRRASWQLYPRVWIPLAIAAALSLGSAVRHRRFGPRHAVATLGVLYGVMHFVGQGKGWEYHLYPLAAFVSVLAFAEIGPLLAERRALLAAPVAASLVAALALLGTKGVWAADATWIRDKERLVSLCVADLETRVRPGDTVQVLDTTDGAVHALLRLGLREPTRFVYDFHFFHDVDAPQIRALRAELVRDLDAHPPRAIVLFEHAWPAGGYARIDGFPALAERLATRYMLAVERAGYRLYAKRNDP